MDSTCCDEDEFRNACARFPTCVTVTTVIGENGLPYGITLSSFTSVSLSPPLVLVCIDLRSPVLLHFAVGKYFGVNVLAAHQKDLSIKFSRDWKNRFTGVKWNAGRTGVPLLCDVLTSFECQAIQAQVIGDHRMFVGKVLQARFHNGAPLIYVSRCYASASVSQAD